MAPSDTKNQSEIKGIPGFSGRLNYLFDLAKAPTDTRQTWGSLKWGCVPNTVARWLKEDCPPGKFATLQTVVDDLLKLIPGRYDTNTTLAWLYTGQANPFEVDTSSKKEAINHILQARIYNRLYQICDLAGEDLDNLNQDQVNRIVSIIYWYLTLRRKAGLDNDPKFATPLMKQMLAPMIPQLNL